MAKKLTVTLKDVNGINGSTHFWCNNEIEAALALQNIGNMTNAQIVAAYMSELLDISTVSNNTAAAANVETAMSKAKIRLTGPDAGSVANPFGICIVSIPAPVGTIINGVTGDITNALVTAFVPLVVSHAGVTMTAVNKVFYSRAR